MKLWLATVATTPFVFASLVAMIDPDTLDLYPMEEILVLVIFFGFILSIPTLLLVSLLTGLFRKRDENAEGFKFNVILFSVIGVIVTFSLLATMGLEKKEFNWGITLVMLYIACIVIFGRLFKIKLNK
jgi:hypothetical protein